MDTKKKSWIHRTRQGPKSKWIMDLVGTGSDEMYFQSFVNFWILLLLKCNWRNGKGKAGSFLEARGAGTLESGPLNSPPKGKCKKTKGEACSHITPRGRQRCCFTLHLQRHHVGSVFGRMLCPWWWGDFPLGFTWNWGGVWRWSREGRETCHWGWKRVMYQTDRKKTRSLGCLEMFQKFQNKQVSAASQNVLPLI